MQKISFSAQFYNPGTRIKSISGRLGPFIFRTSKNGQISAYYKPKNGSLSSHSAANYESLSSHLREIAADMGISITSINYNYD